MVGVETYPEHIKRRLRFLQAERLSPDRLRETFRHYPLDKEFVDWVSEQGFEIVYVQLPSWFDRIDFKDKRIVVGSQGDSWERSLSKVHELVHIALTENIDFPEGFTREGKEYSTAMDEISLQYVDNIDSKLSR